LCSKPRGAINKVLQHLAKDPVVRVVDENDRPVCGASVTFMLPDSGASGEFGGRELDGPI
jgi:hypothetical protein